MLEPRVPLFMARDKQEHARRRKVWDQGYTTKGKLSFLHVSSATNMAR